MDKVYILKNAKGIVKIGYTGVAAEGRRTCVSHRMCSDFSVVAYFDNPKTSARDLEYMIHNLCSQHRTFLTDCYGQKCYEYYNFDFEGSDSVLALVILYLAEATAREFQHHEFASNVPYKSDIKKVMINIKKQNAAIAEGFVLKSGVNGGPSIGYSDTELPTHTDRGRGWETVRDNQASNELVMRFDSKSAAEFRFTKSEQIEMPRFAEAVA